MTPDYEMKLSRHRITETHRWLLANGWEVCEYDGPNFCYQKEQGLFMYFLSSQTCDVANPADIVCNDFDFSRVYVDRESLENMTNNQTGAGWERVITNTTVSLAVSHVALQ